MWMSSRGMRCLARPRGSCRVLGGYLGSCKGCGVGRGVFGFGMAMTSCQSGLSIK